MEESAVEAAAALESAQLQAKAMEALYILQQKYSAGAYEECQALIQQMEANGLEKALSPIPVTTETGSTVTAPYNRFLQFKEAVEAKLDPAIGSTFWG